MNETTTYRIASTSIQDFTHPASFPMRLGRLRFHEFRNCSSHDIDRDQITASITAGGIAIASPFQLHLNDAIHQLLSQRCTNSGALVNAFSYSYDPAGNRHD